MVTILNTGYSIRSILNYNENKVKAGIAACIGAANYPVDVDKMSAIIKLNRFKKRIELNENVKRNSVHISVNFSPSENHSKEKLMAIADIYMKKIGFGKQPYLVYQHYDAGHPHLHLVSINIERDGKRIDLNLHGIKKSEPARKEIEELFGLVKAEGQKKAAEFHLQPVAISKVHYGRMESKKAITDVLNVVLNQYKYASLPELNAVLKQYNIMANRGGQNSKMFLAKGLMYQILDEQGKPIGIPIKASDFFNKPTLKFLEEKFKDNEVRRIPDKTRLKNGIDRALLRQKGMTVNELVKTLEKEGINTFFKKNGAGLPDEIIYVDHVSKCVFNGSALGIQYSAQAIQERCGLSIVSGQKTTGAVSEKSHELTAQKATMEMDKTTAGDANKSIESNTVIAKVVDVRIQFEQTATYVPNQLKGKRKGQSYNQ
ncbi:relaxase/mobilization nuclease domain-containing protein [Flavobacterium sp. ZS1P14]|uniref:relaxase/mobilization nuclease domain-containing protein n=1 Tax=Flavobacterium sp. ZS1P14 TaxID=3401729 RepID=UPI003AAF3697